LSAFRRYGQAWGDEPEIGWTTVQLTIELDTVWQPRLRIVRRIKDRIVCGVACWILDKEISRLKKIAGAPLPPEEERNVMMELLVTGLKLLDLLGELTDADADRELSSSAEPSHSGR
jgi:hypothetical protein